jgi:hypothetical protein
MKIKFGNSGKLFDLIGSVMTDSVQGLFITLPSSSVKFDDLSSDLATYNGDIYLYNDESVVVSEYHGYEDKPTVRAESTEEGMVFKLYLQKIKLQDIDSINDSLQSLKTNATKMSEDIQTNKNDVASALDAIVSLFEATTATTDTTTPEVTNG